MDDADVTLDLPGRWNKELDGNGRYFTNGLQDIYIDLIQLPEGFDPVRAAALLIRAQVFNADRGCRGGTAVVSAPTPAATRPGAFRRYYECDHPGGVRLVVTFIALTVGGDVVSYEHFWPSKYSAALDRADDVILASLQVQPLATSCAGVALEQASGACMEAVSLGQAAVERCGQALLHRGWKRDETAAQAIGSQTTKTLVCYRRPPNPLLARTTPPTPATLDH